ncbi:hypothetical protein [Streptomyces thioluteus]
MDPEKLAVLLFGNDGGDSGNDQGNTDIEDGDGGGSNPPAGCGDN